MRSDWRELPFEQAIDFQEGPGILAKDFRPNGVPLVRLSGLGAGVSVLDGCDFLDPETVERRWAHFRLRTGDILLSTSASLGRIAIADESAEGAIPYTGIIRMRPRDRGLDAPFIRYLLESPHFQRQVEAAGVGSVIRHFGPMHLRQMTLLLPSPPEQRAIASVLGSLDDKIDLNRRMNATLEATARAIFRAWFVDFEALPVEAGRREPVAMVAERASAYGRATSHVAAAGVPRGWQMTTLGDRLSTALGGTPSRSEPRYWLGGTIPWINSGKANEFRVIAPSERITDAGLRESATKMLPKRTTIVAITGATLGQVSLLEIEACANQSIVGILPSGGIPPEYVYLWVKENIDLLVARQTGGAQQHVNTNDVKALPLLVPSPEILRVFSGVACPIFDQIAGNCLESETLAALRDTLLPKLLSGEVRVKDIA